MAAKAGRLQIQLEMQVAQLQRDLDKATRSIDNSAKNWKQSFTSVFTGTLATQFVTQLGSAITQTIADLGDIADKSLALGDTVEMFQRLSYAADQSGVSMESVVSASNKLQKALGEGSKETAAALNVLGLSIEQVKNLSTGEAFITVAGRLGELTNASQQAALAADTLGKGFAAIKPLAAQGEDALRTMTLQAQVASAEAVKAADDYGDAVAEMQGVVKVFIAEALTPLLPLLRDMVKEFTNTGTAASGAAEGMDRSTSSARQLGVALANTYEAAAGFKELMAAISTRPLRYVWEEGESKGVTKWIDDIGNAWSRMTNHFNDVQGGVRGDNIVDRAKEAAKAAQEAADAAEREAEAAAKAAAAKAKAASKRTTGPSKEDRDAQRAAERAEADARAYLAAQEDALQRQINDGIERETALINERTLAQMRANGATQEQIDLARLQMAGASDRELQLTQEIQAIEKGTEAAAEAQRRMAEDAAMYTDMIVGGFNDIFYSMTQGSEEAIDAVKRLVAELLALYLTQQAMNALGLQQNAAGNWFRVNAKGNVYDQHGLVPFAMGGIVRGATPFTFGGGRLGVMGEAGPEAIMPLGRDSAGRLGVRGGGVTVNVHNNSNAQVGVEQNGSNVDIIVQQVRGVIANDFARGGNVVTTAFEGAYGVRR